MKKVLKRAKKVVDSFVEAKPVVVEEPKKVFPKCDHAWLPTTYERDNNGVAVGTVKKCGNCGAEDHAAV